MTDLFSPLAQDRWFGVSLFLDMKTRKYVFLAHKLHESPQMNKYKCCEYLWEFYCLIGKVNDFVLDMQEICKKRDANVVFCISFCSFCKRSSP